jgi:hypothetical protein
MTEVSGMVPAGAWTCSLQPLHQTVLSQILIRQQVTRLQSECRLRTKPLQLRTHPRVADLTYEAAGIVWFAEKEDSL